MTTDGPEEAQLNPNQRVQLMKIRDMELPAEARRGVPDAVQDLTVQDLEDLARKLSGLETYNPRIERLTWEDLRGLDELFMNYKRAKVDQLSEQAQLSDLSELQKICDYTCCCCTPCCCCAAVESDPLAVTA